jgi:DNA integrity scanning protein DisA with diadenylate cyclase activity
MLPFDFGIKDVIDVFLVALMLYNIYRLMKESRSLNVFFGIMVFVVIWLFVSQILEMRLLGSIMDKLVSVGVIALIVLFQEEIRKFLFACLRRAPSPLNVQNKNTVILPVQK